MEDIKLEKQLPVITMNYEDVKLSLIEGAKKYKNIVVTEEGLKDCKLTQKELAGTRIKIDKYRKEIKKEMTIPITYFENQCKELIALIEEVEEPIKIGIEVFNDKVREEKRNEADELILEFVIENKLDNKRSILLTVLDKYLNLTAKTKETKADIFERGTSLLKEQLQEEDVIKTIKETIENVNKGLNAKLEFVDFNLLVSSNISTSEVIKEINLRAERIKENEAKAENESKLKAEKETLERIAKAEKEIKEKAEMKARIEIEMRMEAERKENEKLEKIKIEEIKKIEKEKFEIELAAKIKIEKEESEKKAELQKIEDEKNRIIKAKNDAIENLERIKKEKEKANVKKYFVEIRVENMTKKELSILSEFLKNNNYEYEATKKGLMK